LFTIYSVFT